MCSQGSMEKGMGEGGEEMYSQLCSAVQTEQAMYAQRGKDKLIVAE